MMPTGAPAAPPAIVFAARPTSLSSAPTGANPRRGSAREPLGIAGAELMVSRSEDDLLLFALQMDKMVLSQEVEAYQNTGGVLLPLGEICRLLELPIATSPFTGIAEGWFLREDHRFQLDVRAGTATLDGKALPYDRTLVEVHRNDIFIDTHLLNLWFSLGLTTDRNGALLTVSPREPLPLQRRLERERQSAKLGQSGHADSGFPLTANPYALLGGPAIDQTLTLNHQPGVGSGAGTNVPSLRYTAAIAADVAHVGLNAFVLLEPGKAVQVPQFSLGQADVNGGLLGSLHAREVKVGQVYGTGVPLVTGQRASPGLLIHNYPLVRSSQFDVTSFLGPVPPGWDVELYRGDALMAYKAADSTGNYEFPNVPLLFGRNRFRLVFYGPHGERREETRDFNVDSSLVPRGQNWYQMSLQPGANGNHQFSLQDEFGLRGNLSTTFGLMNVRLLDGMHQLGSVGVRGFKGGLLGYANWLAEPGTGTVQQYGVQSQWKRSTIEVKQVYASGLDTPVNIPDISGLRKRTSLRLGNIALPRGAHLLPTDIELLRGENITGGQRWELRNRLSYQQGGISLTNRLFGRWETGQPTLGQGELLMNGSAFGRRLQGQVSYGWSPGAQLRQMSIQTQQILRDRRLLSLTLYHTATDRNNGITAGTSRSVGAFAYGTTASLSSRHGLTLGMSISMGALRNPENGRWDNTAQAQTSTGAVAVRAYFDKNGNGRRDKNEQVLPNVKFFANDFVCREATGKDGTAIIDGLPQFQSVDLRVCVETLSDPLWVPQTKGVKIIPRPGSIPVLDFPIVGSGEVSGTVFLKGSAGRQEAAGITLELVDCDGRVLQKTSTAYDGFYTLSRVPAGSHRIRVVLPKTDGPVPPEKAIRIPPEGAFLDGIDIVIRKPQA